MGGEEFICILPYTEFEGVMKVAEQIRHNVEALAIEDKLSITSNYVTISAGVLTTVVDNIEQMTTEKLLKLCDEQLYTAKSLGRNRLMGSHLEYIININIYNILLSE